MKKKKKTITKFALICFIILIQIESNKLKIEF